MKNKKRKKKKGERRDIPYIRSYIWIFILLLLTFIAYDILVPNKNDFASNFLLNFGTGLLQTIIIVVLIERKMFKQEEANRIRMQIYALKSLKMDLYRQIGLVLNFLSLSESYQDKFEEYSILELLNYGNSIKCIENTKFCLYSGNGIAGYKTVWDTNVACRNTMIDMLTIYSSYLDSDLMDSITIILHNSFFNTFRDDLVYETLKSEPHHEFFLLQGQKESIEEYVKALSHIIEKYNFYNKDNKIESLVPVTMNKL